MIFIVATGTQSDGLQMRRAIQWFLIMEPATDHTEGVRVIHPTECREPALSD